MGRSSEQLADLAQVGGVRFNQSDDQDFTCASVLDSRR